MKQSLKRAIIVIASSLSLLSIVALRPPSVPAQDPYNHTIFCIRNNTNAPVTYKYRWSKEGRAWGHTVNTNPLPSLTLQPGDIQKHTTEYPAFDFFWMYLPGANGWTEVEGVEIFPVFQDSCTNPGPESLVFFRTYEFYQNNLGIRIRREE